MTTRLTDMYFTLEAQVDLEDLAEQLIDSVNAGYGLGLSEDDLREFILLLVAEANSYHLDNELLHEMQKIVANHDPMAG